MGEYSLARGVASLIRGSDSTFQLVNEKRYDAWGTVMPNTPPGEALANPSESYCANLGHKLDAVSGLIYMRARYYEPGTGRFISEDPAMDGANWFLYCENDPIQRVDPTGKYALCLVSLLVVLIEGAISAAVDLGIQLASNGGSWSNVNWGQVGVSAAIGMVGGVVGHFFRAAFYSKNALKLAAWTGEAKGAFSTYFMKFMGVGTATSKSPGSFTAIVRSMILGGGAGIFMQMYGGFLQSYMGDD